MVRSLLQMVVAAQQELGLPQSATVIGNADVSTNQLLGYAQYETELQLQLVAWTDMQLEFNITVNPPTILTGTVTNNSAIITGLSSTAVLEAYYWQVSGNGIPTAARIKSVDSATQITMTMQATATSSTSVTFGKDTYAEPSDFGWFLADTWYDRTNRWKLLGPDSPQQDQLNRSGVVSFGPRRHFRQIGPLANSYRIWPAPTDVTVPLQLVFEYVSKNAVATAGNRANRSQFYTLDTDIPLLDDRAIIMGMKWRFWAQKGFDAARLEREYDIYVERLIARDGGNKTLSLIQVEDSFLLDFENVQDGSFPGFIGTNSS